MGLWASVPVETGVVQEDVVMLVEVNDHGGVIDERSDELHTEV